MLEVKFDKRCANNTKNNKIIREEKKTSVNGEKARMQQRRPNTAKNKINEINKFIKKIVANEFNSLLKGSYTMIKWDLSLGCKNGSIYANQ